MKESADLLAYSLSRVRWDVFGTLTFGGTVPRQNKAFCLAWEHFRRAAKITGRPYCELLIALRSEHGEKNGRFHFHYLLGGTETSNLITLSHQLEHAWTASTGNKIVDVRPYDRTRAGVEYLTKCLGGDVMTHRTGGDAYEMSKFDMAETVTLSKSVYRVIGQTEGIGGDTAARTRRKNGDVKSILLGSART